MFRAVCLAALLGIAGSGCGTEPDDRPAELPYLVTAILRPSCGTAACHSSLSRVEGLAFDTLEAARATFAGEEDMVDEIDPENSDLLRVLDGDKVRMPPDEPMADADIALIRAWVYAGGPP